MAAVAAPQAYGDEQISCDGGEHGIKFAEEGDKIACWMTKIELEGETSLAYCSYREGTDVPLKALNDWSIDVSGRSVRIFHGTGNHCSAGEFLLFNQMNKMALIVHSDFSTEKHQCE